jgi:3-deoxy-D-manno-octulosonate 8-phosphate phosphatase (KDO 8-P phosphatase)
LELLVPIKAIALDVDGVLTDGGFWWGPNDEEWKRFCFADVMGLSLARKAGVRLALITGEKSPIVDRLASKMGVTDVFQDCKDKARALRSLAEHHHLRLEDICFMGDDINDLSALEIAGLAAAPANARPAVLEKCQFVTKATAGNGAVRELIDHVLAHAEIGATGERLVT